MQLLTHETVGIVVKIIKEPWMMDLPVTLSRAYSALQRAAMTVLTASNRFRRFTVIILLLQGLALTGCIGTATSQEDGSRLSQIGDVRGDGPPRSVDRKRLVLVDAIPQRLALSATGNAPYVLAGRTFTPLKSGTGYVATGVASWYGKKFHGRRTSSGEAYDMYAMTAAHRILPLPSFVRVTNLDSGRQAVLKVNDRGPFRGDRLIDLSYAAAVKLGADVTGTINVRVEVVEPPAPVATTVPEHSTTLDAAGTASQGVSQANDYRLFLQAGAFVDEANAERFRHRLVQAGLGPVEVAPFTRAAGQIFRVRIGPLKTQRSAHQQQLKLTRQFNTSGRLVFQRHAAVED